MTDVEATRKRLGAEYRTGTKRAEEIANEITPFTIAVEGMAVMWRHSNGSTQFMTYRKRVHADRALARVQALLPGATVFEDPTHQIRSLTAELRQSIPELKTITPEWLRSLTPEQQAIIVAELTTLQTTARRVMADIEDHLSDAAKATQ